MAGIQEPGRLTDLDGVGIRLDAYAKISTPTVLLGAERSPAHLTQSLDALAAVMPNAEKIVLPRRDHLAHQKAPTKWLKSYKHSPAESSPRPATPARGSTGSFDQLYHGRYGQMLDWTSLPNNLNGSGTGCWSPGARCAMPEA